MQNQDAQANIDTDTDTDTDADADTLDTFSDDVEDELLADVFENCMAGDFLGDDD